MKKMVMRPVFLILVAPWKKRDKLSQEVEASICGIIIMVRILLLPYDGW